MHFYFIFTPLAVLQIASALPLYNRSVHLSESLTGFDAVQASTPFLRRRDMSW
jgi:hypothetical protein